VYLISVECPRAELHRALLLVEREVRDVDRTRTLVDGWRDPQHVAVVEDDDIRFVRHFVLTIRAANTPRNNTAQIVLYISVLVISILKKLTVFNTKLC